jgi:hypothetical protein
MDENERAAIRDEGYEPDDPKVIAALERVRVELDIPIGDTGSIPVSRTSITAVQSMFSRPRRADGPDTGPTEC